MYPQIIPLKPTEKIAQAAHESSIHLVHAREASVAAAEEEVRHQEAIVDAAGSRASPEQRQSLLSAHKNVILAKEEHKSASKHEETLRRKTGQKIFLSKLVQFSLTPSRSKTYTTRQLLLYRMLSMLNLSHHSDNVRWTSWRSN